MAKRKTDEEFKKQLKEKFPQIKPKGIYTNGMTKIPFECVLDGFEWRGTPSNVLQHGCSCCNGHYMNDYTFKQKMKKVNNKVEVIGTYKDRYTTVKCRCLLCDEPFDGNVPSLLNGSTHDKCRGKQITKTKTKSTEWFINKLNEAYPNEYEVLGNYTKKKEPIKIRHKCGHEWSPTPDSLLSSRSKCSPCPKCSKVYSPSDEEYKEILREVNPTIISLERYINSDTKILHKCLVCNHEWRVQPGSLVGNVPRGCPMCKGGTDTVIRGINDIWTTNPEMAEMLMNPEDGYKYSEGTSKKVEWKCKDCGESAGFKSIHKVKQRGLYCKRCSPKRSFPNRIMYNLLSELNEDFKDEKHFSWCVFESYNKTKNSTGVYDFVIENKKLIIEMDGSVGHGYESAVSRYSVEEALYRDAQKDKLALKHGYTVIRIDCSRSEASFIKESILNSPLFEIYDFSNINWNKCFYHSTTPIMKNICIDFNNGLTITELKNKYSKDASTIMKFLDIGTEAGLCNYTHNGNKRQVICLNDLQVVESINETSRVYDISVPSIRKCCDGVIAEIKDIYNKRNGLALKFMYYENYIKLHKKQNPEGYVV